MIVYAESNFLLELAFEQEQVRDCQAILELAESGQILLVLPAFSIGECVERLGRKKARRMHMHIKESLQGEIRELGRSRSGAALSEQLRTLIEAVIAGTEEDNQRYDHCLRRLLDCAHWIPLETASIRQSLQTRATYDLTPQDALVLTCVIAHLTATSPPRAVFLNKNKKDFAIPDIVDALRRLNCVLKPDFAAGAAYLRSELARNPDTPKNATGSEKEGVTAERPRGEATPPAPAAGGEEHSANDPRPDGT